MSIPPIDSKRRVLLITALFVGACGWGISVIFLIGSWDKCMEQFRWMGVEGLQHEPILEYWLRMAAAAFTWIGALFGAAAFRPAKFAAVIPWLGWFSLVVGLVLLWSGWSVGMTRAKYPAFVPDIVFCLSVGAAIVGACWGERGNAGSQGGSPW